MRLVFALALAAAACSETGARDPDAGHGGAARSSSVTGAADAAPSADATASDGAGDGPPDAAAILAPYITGLMKMAGALHVNWKNLQPDCDSIDGERESSSAPYEVVFTVPGFMDNMMDMLATENTTYTYRLRCKKGEAYSPYSNEESANPTE